MAIDPDGNLVTANIGLGRVQRMTRDGQASTVLEEVDGQRTTSANFVFYDRRGRLWVTCLPREDHWWPAVAHPRPDGFSIVVEGPREDALATFLDRLEAGTAVPDDLLAYAGPRLQFPTSVCFAGQDLPTAYVGSLAMSRLPTFRAPVPGLPMRHWS